MDFGFWILDFGFWILDFGFWILDFGSWILDFGFCTRFGFCIRLLLLHADSGRRITTNLKNRVKDRLLLFDLLHLQSVHQKPTLTLTTGGKGTVKHLRTRVLGSAPGSW